MTRDDAVFHFCANRSDAIAIAAMEGTTLTAADFNGLVRERIDHLQLDHTDPEVWADQSFAVFCMIDDRVRSSMAAPVEHAEAAPVEPADAAIAELVEVAAAALDAHNPDTAAAACIAAGAFVETEEPLARFTRELNAAIDAAAGSDPFAHVVGFRAEKSSWEAA